MENKRVLFYVSIWFMKLRNLPVGRIIERIAVKEVINKSLLRDFEKLSCKLASLKLDIQYFNKCLELNLIPEFLKFKPPKLEVYKNSQIYFQKVLNEQRKAVCQKLTACKYKQQQLCVTLKEKIRFYAKITSTAGMKNNISTYLILNQFIFIFEIMNQIVTNRVVKSKVNFT